MHDRQGFALSLDDDEDESVEDPEDENEEVEEPDEAEELELEPPDKCLMTPSVCCCIN